MIERKAILVFKFILHKVEGPRDQKLLLKGTNTMTGLVQFF
jgi:hypothetical protein